MSGNRVEELEETVTELQATVAGLTDELVETKERLHVLEDHIGPELDEMLTGSADSTDGDTSESVDAQTKPAESNNEETADSDEIIVA